MAYKIAVFSSKPYWVNHFTQLKSTHEFHYFPFNLTIENVDLAKGFPVISCFVNDKVDAKVVEILANNGTKAILLRCTGTNAVDLEAASKFNIAVMKVPSYSPCAISEFALSLILSLNRKVHRAFNRVREGNFEINGLEGFNIKGKTVGIVGTGQIGLGVCRSLGLGLGAKVIAYDVYKSQEAKDMGVEYVESMEEIWKRSDIISLHTPLLESTKYMVNENSIAQMKEGVMLINVSRGGLVDTKAVINGLKSGKIGYLGMDVYENESSYFFEDCSASVMKDDLLARLTTFSNVILTSHQAWYTQEAIHSICQTSLNNLDNWSKAEFSSANIVNSFK
ncbi:hypothetical protein CYY_005193 [Polysphondylium violaceum]|uniref:D-lactate dehydrogenase n=1 Tax=Polysphondylium violaceum TaxID=133409 RepID=A0A8J4V723_9MYCE|nr:hypothetical protein CYY_005193 [Polysphondylium violaceum]